MFRLIDAKKIDNKTKVKYTDTSVIEKDGITNLEDYYSARPELDTLYEYIVEYLNRRRVTLDNVHLFNPVTFKDLGEYVYYFEKTEAGGGGKKSRKKMPKKSHRKTPKK